MSNTEVDLDTLLPVNLGSGREIFDPVAASAWPGASDRIYVSTHRSGPQGAVQIGYDPEHDKSWVRAQAADGSGWSDWMEVAAPPPVEPPPEDASKSKAKAKAKAEDEDEASASSKKK